MTKHILFLLKPGFKSENNAGYFCPDCAVVEGFLSYAPAVENQLDVRRVDFQRPRREIIELLGEANQGCPVLVLADGIDLPPEASVSEETGRGFVAGGNQICDYLGIKYGVARPHL
jgi:hypothetical protein